MFDGSLPTFKAVDFLNEVTSDDPDRPWRPVSGHLKGHITSQRDLP